MVSQISSWIMSIAGIVCISVIVELILPEGQLNKYIKGIFSFIIVLVIVMPIPKIINSNFDFSSIFDYENSVVVDEEYVYQLNLDKLNSLQEDIEHSINKYGYEEVNVYINCNIFQNKMDIKSITVDLTNLVITENAEHKDITKIKQHIAKIILSYISLNEEEILYVS